MLKSNLIGFLAALRFLTILPISWYGDRDGQYFRSSVHYFPLIGLLIGGGGALLCLLFSSFIPDSLLPCVLVLYLGSISGFLHLDGLADSADGLLSARPREQKLRIMHDSRTGAMGVIALVLLLLFKYAGLLAIPAAELATVVVYIPFAGRCALVLSMACLPYARKEGGLGGLFYGHNRFTAPAVALLILLLTGLCSSFSFAVVAFGALTATTLLFGLWCRKAIGGMTGDTLGGVCELTEATVIFFFAIFLNH